MKIGAHEAEANRLEMMERGIWGVPSFRVGDTITWGQDRLWVIEHALQKQTKIIRGNLHAEKNTDIYTHALLYTHG